MVAAEDIVNGHIYVYVQNTGAFHRNDPLANDFYYDRSKSYEVIDVSMARALMETGLGRINEATFGWVVEEFRADPRPLSVETVLGA